MHLLTSSLDCRVSSALQPYPRLIETGSQRKSLFGLQEIEQAEMARFVLA